MPRVRTWQLALNWQAQSFQQDKHEDKRSGINTSNQRREEEEPYVQCLGKHKRRGRRQAPSGAHKSREETKKEDERKTKDASTTRCVHINTVSPAPNPDTLTIGLKLWSDRTDFVGFHKVRDRKTKNEAQNQALLQGWASHFSKRMHWRWSWHAKLKKSQSESIHGTNLFSLSSAGLRRPSFESDDSRFATRPWSIKRSGRYDTTNHTSPCIRFLHLDGIFVCLFLFFRFQIVAFSGQELHLTSSDYLVQHLFLDFERLTIWKELGESGTEGVLSQKNLQRGLVRVWVNWTCCPAC